MLTMQDRQIIVVFHVVSNPIPECVLYNFFIKASVPIPLYW